MKDMIYETLNKLINNETQRKQPSYTYLDESDGKIKSRALQSAGSAYITHIDKNPAKLIHDLIFQ